MPTLWLAINHYIFYYYCRDYHGHVEDYHEQQQQEYQQQQEKEYHQEKEQHWEKRESEEVFIRKAVPEDRSPFEKSPSRDDKRPVPPQFINLPSVHGTENKYQTVSSYVIKKQKQHRNPFTTRYVSL